MRSHLLFLIIFASGLLLSFPLVGQENRQDSLWLTWQDPTLHDTLRLEALLKVIKRQNDLGRHDSVIRLGKAFLEVAAQPGYERFQIHYHIQMAIGPLWRSFSEAEASLKKSIRISTSIGHQKGLLVGQYWLADLYAKNGDPHRAIRTYQQSLTTAQGIPHPIGSYNALIGLGMEYRNLADYPQAIKYLRQSEKIAKTLDFPHPLARSYSFIGDVYRLNGDKANALIYYQKNLALLQSMDQVPNLTMTYYNISTTCNSLGKTAEALTYAEKAREAAEASEEDYAYHLGYVMDLFGEIYRNQGKFTEAISYFQKRLELGKKQQSTYAIAYANYLIGDCYRQQGNFPLAIQHCEASRKLFSEIKRFMNEKNACTCLYQANKAKGNFEAALLAFEQAESLTDSLHITESALELQKMEFSRQALADSLAQSEENRKREAAHHAEIQQKNRTQYLLAGTGAVILLLAFGLWSRLRFIRNTQIALEEKNALIQAEKEKAEASERAKQQFLANMSHEIRTPMNAIKGMTDILLRREPQAEQLSYLSAIKESSHSLLVIINDILDLAKVEAGKIELEQIPFDLRDVIDNVATIMQFKAEEKGLELRSRLPEDLPGQVIGDPTRLHQVLLNLVGNAIKFTEKGVVSIRLQTEMAPEENLVQAQFCVSDTGVGIGEDRLDKIFESFEQAYTDTTRKFGGTGLGLSISKKLVEIQNGKIWAESEKGKGSQFYVSLQFPIAAGTTVVQDAPPAEANVAEQLAGIRILLVEDNTFNAIVAQEELEDSIPQVQVDVAENGAIAVEKAKTNDYDLVLMDVQMPVMNGYEATQKIRALAPEKARIPIIAMTANVMKEEVDRCYAAGMDDFIGKPFEVEELIQKIASLHTNVS